MRQLSADGRRPCPQDPGTRALTHQAAVVTVLLSRGAILKFGNDWQWQVPLRSNSNYVWRTAHSRRVARLGLSVRVRV